jgi:hypothetical protein
MALSSYGRCSNQERHYIRHGDYCISDVVTQCGLLSRERKLSRNSCLPLRHCETLEADRWFISYDGISFMNCGLRHFWNDALRNRMTERTSYLAGLWIGAAISNTSHSNKAGSTTAKRAWLTGKESRSTPVLPQ